MTQNNFAIFLFGKIEKAVVYIVKGKAQQKSLFKRDIKRENTKGFGELPTRKMRRIFNESSKTYKSL